MNAKDSIAASQSYLLKTLLEKKGDDYATTILWIRAKVSYDQPCSVSEEPGEREEQPIYLTLKLHREVRKPEFK